MTKGDYFLLEEWVYQHELAGQVTSKDMLKFCRKFLIDETDIPYDLKEYYRYIAEQDRAYKTETELEFENKSFERWLEDSFDKQVERRIDGEV